MTLKFFQEKVVDLLRKGLLHMKYQDGAYLHQDKLSTKQMSEASLWEVNKDCVCVCPISISKTVLKKAPLEVMSQTQRQNIW